MTKIKLARKCLSLMAEAGEYTDEHLRADSARLRDSTPIYAEPEVEYAWKVLVIGKVAVGKTSLVHRITRGTYTAAYKSTVGVDFSQTTIKVEGGRIVAHLQLWDVAGQERFGNMTKFYSKNAMAAIVVCDNDPSSIPVADKWKRDVDAAVMLPDGKRQIPMLLVINKSDLAFPGDYPDDEAMGAHVKQHGYIGVVRVSSKEGTMCKEMLRGLLKHMLKIGVDIGSKRDVEDHTDDVIKFPAYLDTRRSRTCACTP